MKVFVDCQSKRLFDNVWPSVSQSIGQILKWRGTILLRESESQYLLSMEQYTEKSDEVGCPEMQYEKHDKILHSGIVWPFVKWKLPESNPGHSP